VIDEMNARPLAFVVHVGDIGNARLGCTDAWVEARRAQFARIQHPFVLLPGDNEWTDCRQPLERLEHWRRLFCIKKHALQIETQPGPFCEHIRWEAGGFVFVALNVQGSNNNLRQPEFGPRMQAVYAWLDEAARLAEKRRGLIVLIQADPFTVLPHDGFAGFRDKLAELGKRMPGKVVLVHGDTHIYRDDEPIPGVRRVEVWGSPFVAWLEARIGADGLSVRQGP
jgi:hypothetical protein